MAKIKYARPPQKGPIQVPNCAEVKVIWVTAQGTFENVYHTQLSAAGPLAQTVAEAVFSALKANAATTAFLTKVHTTWSLAAVHVKDLRAINMPTIISTGASVLGTSAGLFMPTDVALVVTLRTQYSGRGWVGRTYLGGITQDNLLDSRHWLNTGAFNSIMANYVNAISSATVSAGLGPLGVMQRQLLPSPDPTAPPPYNQPRAAHLEPVTSINIASNRVDSQRRRIGR